jgi:hypothetical protein
MDGLVMIELVAFEPVGAPEVLPSHLLDEYLVAQAMDRLPKVRAFHQFLGCERKKHSVISWFQRKIRPCFDEKIA